MAILAINRFMGFFWKSFVINISENFGVKNRRTALKIRKKKNSHCWFRKIFCYLRTNIIEIFKLFFLKLVSFSDLSGNFYLSRKSLFQWAEKMFYGVLRYSFHFIASSFSVVFVLCNEMNLIKKKSVWSTTDRTNLLETASTLNLLLLVIKVYPSGEWKIFHFINLNISFST